MDDELPAHVKYWIDYLKKDCFFNVGPSSGPNEQIGAIKILLMGHSEPLRKMLEESDLAEKGEIILPDIEPNSFKNFLKCVYGGSDVVIKHMTFEECAKLLYIAEKYLVTQVKKDVIKKMMKQEPFSLDELFVTLKHIVCFQDKTLKNAITDVLMRYTNELFVDRRFLDISSEALMMIVQQESLNVKELDVFKAVVKWAENKLGSQDGSVIREYISGFIQFIRFRIMSIEEFCLYVIPTNILTTEEGCRMCTSIVSNKPHKLTMLSDNKEVRLDCQTLTKTRVVYSCIAENICKEEVHLSGLTEIGDYSWQFILKNNNDYLSLYLDCEPRFNTAPTWECNANVELILVNQCGKEDFKMTTSHRYDVRESDWGYTEFKEWADVVDPTQGFIKHGSITVVAYITLT